MKYTSPQRQLLVESFISMIGLQPFWPRLGSGQKQNAIESINYFCHGPRFGAENLKDIAKLKEEAAKAEEAVPDFDYKFEFEWHIPGVNEKVTLEKSVKGAKFEALR